MDGTSFELDVSDPKAKAYIMGKFTGFLSKYAPCFITKNYRNLVSDGASVTTGALGHGPVGTYPDRPFLRWRFKYKHRKRDMGWRENQTTYLEACENLHQIFCEYVLKAGISTSQVEFGTIRERVSKILSVESVKEGRQRPGSVRLREGSYLRKRSVKRSFTQSTNGNNRKIILSA
ncbi:MAG: hypothetical protein L3J28_03380 [Candidatus Polarisedimenticolaceae bacterium]|nr:hypothetical protein [Candidatus Polarisedimenticolaceae bacterium]